MRRTGLTEEQADEATHPYATGQSLATVAARFDIDAGTVRTRLIKRGVGMRPTS